MKTIGGRNYRWRGKNIRTIKYQDALCVTMPRKNSTILAPARINVDSFYKIVVTVLNKGGNGKILVGFDNIVSESVYVVSGDFKEYCVNIDTDDINESIDNLVISRPHDSSGTVMVKSITYDEVERPKNEEELELELVDKKRKEQIEIQIKLGKLHAEKHNTYREEQTKKIVADRGDAMAGPVIVVGGKAHRWKGKNIRSVVKGGTTYVILQSAGSMVLEKAYVSPNTIFIINSALKASKVMVGKDIIAIN